MQKSRAIKVIDKNLALLLLLFFYISEAYSKYGMYFDGEKSDIPRIIKLVVLLVLGLGVIRHFRSLLGLLILAFVFCLGQLFLPNGFNTEIVVSFSKLLFPIVLFIYFNKHPLQENSKKTLFRAFEYLLIFNGILMLLGFAFEIFLFNSYKYGRWGFNGLFINTSTSSYIYAIALFYFLLSLKESFLKNWKTIFIIACCLFTGTKIVYIAILGTLLLYLLFYAKLSQKQRNAVLLSLFGAFSLLGYIFFFRLGIFNEIRQEQGLFSAIFSFRDDIFLEQTLPFIQDNWKWPNYLFGGISDLTTRSQMGFIDVFLFWGIIGGVIYLYTFYKTFASKSLTKIGVYIILILALMVFLAGNFFENASVAVYLLILKEKLIDEVSFTNENDLNE